MKTEREIKEKLRCIKSQKKRAFLSLDNARFRAWAKAEIMLNWVLELKKYRKSKRITKRRKK